MAKVIFKNNGEEANAEDDGRLQQTIQTAGWPVAFACEDGVCGTCLIHVTEGAENLSEMDEREKQTLEMMGMDDGEHRLACQCKVKGDVTIEGM